MGRILTRLAGIALVGAGLAGIIFCVVGLFVLARVEQRVESVVTEQLELIERALATTAEGLVLAETSMEQATDTLVSLADSAGGAGQAPSAAQYRLSTPCPSYWANSCPPPSTLPRPP